MQSILYILIAAGLTALAGCASQQAPEQSSRYQIEWADEIIDAQRIVKRRLLVADPIERAIEKRLIADDRTEAARFAINIPTWPQFDGFSDDAPYHFTCVMTTTVPLSPYEAMQILNDALNASDLNARIYEQGMDGRTWALWGTLVRKELENPDLSVLQP